jgi:16S rRNA (cytidine1402-2'-O)-methyltransferase
VNSSDLSHSVNDSETAKSGTLYIVGTPIGNLEDITFRAIRILQTVNTIAAEDTRHTGKLLQHFQIATPQISYHQHNRLSRQEELLTRLKQGNAIALVTDAGMPGISDPGYELVKACIEAEIPVIPIPGVTAAITALTASGLPTDRFIFEGFLPVKGKERRDRINAIQHEPRTLIFYEAPHRLLETLNDFASILGDNRQIVVARELTKLHETFWRGTIKEAIAFYSSRGEPKGELTLVVAGASVEDYLVLSEAELKTELRQLMERGMTRSQASRQLAQLTNLPRRQIYQLASEEE